MQFMSFDVDSFYLMLANLSYRFKSRVSLKGLESGYLLRMLIRSLMIELVDFAVNSGRVVCINDPIQIIFLICKFIVSLARSVFVNPFR